MGTDAFPKAEGPAEGTQFGDPRSCARFEWRQTGTERVIRATGEIDMSNSGDLALGIEGLGERRLTVDLTEVTFIDSTGLRGLMGLAESIAPRPLSLRIKQGSQVDRLLVVTALDDIFSISRC